MRWPINNALFKWYLAHNLYTNVYLKLLSQAPCTVVKLAGWLAQMRPLKPRAANYCPGDTSSTPARVSLSVWTCLLMVWLLPASQGSFMVHRSCLHGHMYWLSSTSTAFVTAASREKGLWVERCSSGEQWELGLGEEKPQWWDYSKYVRVAVGGGQWSSIVADWWWWCPYSWVKRGAPKNKWQSTKKHIHTIAKWLS